MLKNILNLRLYAKRSIFHLLPCRQLTSGEAATALRPFLFAVHPDLFGQHPRERAVNEGSLKVLNEYVTSLQAGRPVKAAQVLFYIRPSESEDASSSDFQEIRLSLRSHDLSVVIKDILKSCDLSLEYVNAIQSDQSEGESFPRPIKWHSSYYSYTGKINPEEKLKSTPAITLRTWLNVNLDTARKGQKSVQPIKEEIERVRRELKEKIGLADIRWESQWGVRHFRGCLRSFEQLYKEKSTWIDSVLKDRSLVFSNCTGYSHHGDIVLSSEDVPSDWMKLLLSVRAYDSVMHRLPYMEEQLSHLLSNVKVVRQRPQRVITAPHYELLLNRLINSLRRVQDDVTCQFFAEDLSHLQLIVDSEEGPMMLTPDGSFQVPASQPPDLVIDFISQNKSQAEQLLVSSAVDKDLENGVTELCLSRLELRTLDKEANITSSQMVDCCDRLIQSYYHIGWGFRESCLRISHYYSVMDDGQILIPWNWQLESDSF